jgi:nucleoside-diphosphate-sugar epimerase
MERVLVTGASGYLGKLAAAALLARTDAELLLPVRRAAGEGCSVVDAVLEELAGLSGHAPADSCRSRIHVLPYPAVVSAASLVDEWGGYAPHEVIHCAGCLDYFNEQELWATNVELTRQVLQFSERIAVRRFIYVSTAFSSGYVSGVVREALHPEPARDPTLYTRTKRAAEWLVAGSPLDTVIIRPSIVIGHSQTGRYTGKQYGLYQLLAGIERLLCSTWEPEFHAVAPRKPIHVLHQDAFQVGLMAARARVARGSIVHLVSHGATCPVIRDLWDLWVDHIFRPQRRFYYDSMADLPVGTMPRRQRALMALASVNLEIAAHDWRFEERGLEALRLGAEFQHATLASVTRCHNLFVASSAKVQQFLTKGPRLPLRERTEGAAAAAPGAGSLVASAAQ